MGSRGGDPRRRRAIAGDAADVQPGAGAIYGPKLEFALRDRRGRSWQLGTIQLDFAMPQRFDLRYVEASGERKHVAMLHRALYGSIERFMGVLLEHHGAALPAFLAPEQIAIVPIAARHDAYASWVRDALGELRVRIERDDSVARRIALARDRAASESVLFAGMAFEPGVTSTATRGRLFVMSGQALRIEPDAELAPDDIFLGVLDGTPCFARGLERDSGATPLRQLFGTLSDDEFGVAGRALGLVAWDRDHRHCGRCGNPTARSTTERARTCTACGFVAYPRISPAIITLVERDGRALLARNARTQMPFYSTLAGFVELGETLEQCVAREVHEEAGIHVRDVAYFGSQPWPFSGSLMVGFTASWASGELAPDPAELGDTGWFAPDALPPIPPKLSIARALIDDFVRRATLR